MVKKHILSGLIVSSLLTLPLGCPQITPQEPAPQEEPEATVETTAEPDISAAESPEKTSMAADKQQATESTAQDNEKTTTPEDTISAKEKDQLKKELESEVELNFNNTSLQNIVDEMGRIFKVTFLPDDVVKSPDSKIPPLSDSKVFFKTNRILTRKRAWDLFTTFLELSGWSLAPTSDPKLYRITVTDNANKSPLPTFINTPLDMLPQNDQRVRYVCFLENSTTDQMTDLLNKLKSQKAVIGTFAALQAVIITDTAYNINSLVQIIRALDKTTDPQILSVLNLREADANEVVALIKDFQSKDDPTTYNPWIPKKETSLYYFSKNVTISASPRTNSIILVGPRDDVERIKHFVIKHIDPELKQVSQPLHVYKLDYAPCEQIAEILNRVVQFGRKSSGKDMGIGELGAVRGGLRYFGDVFIQPEKQNNCLLIRSTKEDFGHLCNIINELDNKQPQVAVEVMIVSLHTVKDRQWGIQWDTKKNRKINAQLSGFFDNSIVTQSTKSPTPNSQTIAANLIKLATSPTAGTTLMTFGKDSVYAILGILSTTLDTRIIANPFIVATNKYKARVAISEERRAKLQEIEGTTQVAGFDSAEAKLEVSILPQINDHGIINLDINVTLEDFSKPWSSDNGPENANKISQKIHTNANVADREIVVLGGLAKKTTTNSQYSFPVLSKIPLIGYLFKNKFEENQDDNLVIFMSPTIIQPVGKRFDEYTENKAQFTRRILKDVAEQFETDERDPIYRWFFKPSHEDSLKDIDMLIHKGGKKSKKDLDKAEPQPQPTPPAQTDHNAIMQSVATDLTLTGTHA